MLVNAAGILRIGATDQLSAEDWQRDLHAVNVGGAFNLFQQTMAQFRRPAGRGDRHRRLRCRAHRASAPSLYGASEAALKSLALTVRA